MKSCLPLHPAGCCREIWGSGGAVVQGRVGESSPELQMEPEWASEPLHGAAVQSQRCLQDCAQIIGCVGSGSAFPTIPHTQHTTNRGLLFLLQMPGKLGPAIKLQQALGKHSAARSVCHGRRQLFLLLGPIQAPFPSAPLQGAFSHLESCWSSWRWGRRSRMEGAHGEQSVSQVCQQVTCRALVHHTMKSSWWGLWHFPDLLGKIRDLTGAGTVSIPCIPLE